MYKGNNMSNQQEANDTVVSEIATIRQAPAPVKFSYTKAAINKLKKKWSKVPDVTTKEGYALAQEAKRELTPHRTTIEKEMKSQKVFAQDHIKNINLKGNELIQMIRDIEDPIYEAKKIQDELVEKEKLAQEQAEEKRILAIEDAVVSINELTADLLGADLGKLEKRLNFANKLSISTDVYMEYTEQASQLLAQKIDQLTNAVTTAKALAEQQKEIDKQQAEMEAQQEEMKKRLDDLADREAETRRIEDKRKAEIQQLEDEHKAEVARAEAEKQRLEEELAAKIQLAAEQEEADKQRAIDDKKTAAELKARLPEDIKLREVAKVLEKTELPEITDETLLVVKCVVIDKLNEIIDYIVNNTQKVK